MPATPAPHGAETLQLTRALQAEQLHFHADRAWQTSAVSLGAGVLTLVALGDGGASLVPWWTMLLALLALRTALHRRAAQVPDAAAAVWLPRLRAMAFLHGLAWSALAWVVPPPASLGDAAALTVLLCCVALAGLWIAMTDRHAGVAFAAAILVPLGLRLASVPADRLEAAAAIGGLALLLAALWAVGRRAETARRALLRAREAANQEALRSRQSEGLLHRVFDRVGEGICVFDGSLRVRAINGRMADLLGLDPALAVPGARLEDWLRQLAAAGEYGAVDVEAEVARRLALLRTDDRGIAQRRRPDGRMIETRRTPLPEGGFAMVCVDITERVASEVALFENRRTLELLLQGTEEGFWFIDNQLRTTDANPAMCRMLGLSREALLGRTIWEFVDAENEAIFRDQVRRREFGQAGTYEITLTRADGGRVRCVNNATPIHDAAGHKIGAIGLFSDVTAERQAAEAARDAMRQAAEKSQVLADTLDSLDQGVLGFDAEFRLHSWNQRAIELLEMPADMLAQRPTLMEIGRWQQAQGMFGDDLQAIDDDSQREIVRRHLDTQGPTGREPLRYRRRRRDGRVIEVQAHHGRDGGQVRTYTDVSAQDQAAAALMAAKDEAERANRAKSEFLSRMSHELRTPLNAILGFGQLMQRDAGAPLSAGQAERLDQILRGGQHLLALINEVLDLSRIEAGALSLTLGSVDVDALTDDCTRMMTPVAMTHGVTLHARDGQAGTAHADVTRLRQVLLNLLSNAIKYNRPEGQVWLRCCRVEDQVCITVEDTGRGLDPDQQGRLFRPFERLQAGTDGVEGTGIGLALSGALATLMNGRIEVHSEPGIGSRFTLRLRQAVAGDGGADVASQAPPAAAEAAQERRRVLYVEDNPVNQLVMQGMLGHRAQIDLQLADTPEQGVAMAAAEPPHLLLLDLQLPGRDGYEVLRLLRSDPRTAQVPALAVSANAMPEDLARASSAGFDGYLTKPLDLTELLRQVDHWLAVGRAG